ncbi:hypothetical protein Fot_02546 [Forsythia ovata]|uniref:Uncharacterized protein n=1 Tax=Forsythia ovata TaxID=205694 RepID=A0ABD1X7M7_9LAMI
MATVGRRAPKCREFVSFTCFQYRKLCFTLDVTFSDSKDNRLRFSEIQIGDIFLRIRGPLFENLVLSRETKSRKNPAPSSTPKVVQTKIFQKTKNPPPAKGVVIKEPSPSSRKPTTDEVAGKDKEKVMEPPPKVKTTSKQAHSSSKVVQLESISGKKRPPPNSRSSPAKKLRTEVSSGPLLAELFRTRPEGL